MKAIKEIHIVFENCDCIKLPAEAIEGFKVDGITQSANMSYSSNGKVLGIDNDAEKCAIWINLNSVTDITIDWVSKKITVHDRIQNHSDITHYYVIYEDGSEWCVCPPWTGENKYKNDSQKCHSYSHKLKNGDSKQVLLVYHGFEIDED